VCSGFWKRSCATKIQSLAPDDVFGSGAQLASFDPLYATATWMCWLVPLALAIVAVTITARRAA